MSAAPFEQAGPLQAQCLEVMWDHGASTVHDVVTVINASRAEQNLPPLAYTTILTVLRNMDRRGLVTRVKTGRFHTYQARQTREVYRSEFMRWVVDTHFQGDESAVLMAMGRGVAG
jgi:predicted transcriptional regulator